MISIREASEIAFAHINDPSAWGSLVINKRKPHTYRAFLQHEDCRICLHRFEACVAEDSFAHPHPWPSSMLVLSGEYEMAVGHTPDLNDSNPSEVIRVRLSAGSIYHMMDRHTWHQVIPRSQCYSLMVNGPRWDGAHCYAPSTGGKGLEEMSSSVLEKHLQSCRGPIANYLMTKPTEY